jgi:hypothetical protein
MACVQLGSAAVPGRAAQLLTPPHRPINDKSGTPPGTPGTPPPRDYLS